VAAGGQPRRPATVAFVGEVHFKPGQWVGVCYDQPVGKNDGSLDGKRYFTCEPGHGGFVLPKSVVLVEKKEKKKEEGSNNGEANE
jgi:tubulin-folding cofactor B